jgi:hypothetical protein
VSVSRGGRRRDGAEAEGVAVCEEGTADLIDGKSTDAADGGEGDAAREGVVADLRDRRWNSHLSHTRSAHATVNECTAPFEKSACGLCVSRGWSR